MKANKIFAILFGCVLALGVSSCVEVAPEYVPGESEIANGAFFLPADKATGVNPAQYTVKGTDTEFTYWVGRSSASGSCTVNIINNNSDARFTVPSSVTFADGETKAPLTVTFSQLPEENCALSFSIDPSSAAIYGAGASSFSGALNCTPFHKLVLGTYKSGTVVAYWGDEYKFNFNIVPNAEDETNSTVIVENFDPYFSGKGYVASKGYQKIIGTLDAENSMIIIAAGQDVGVGCQYIGFNNADPDMADDDDDIYLAFDTTTITILNAYYMWAGGYYEIYPGGIVCSK